MVFRSESRVGNVSSAKDSHTFFEIVRRGWQANAEKAGKPWIKMTGMVWKIMKLYVDDLVG